jgi:hypothetical protein
MLIRFIALVICQIAIITITLFIYDVRWINLALDMKIILSTIGGVAFLLISLMVLISDEKINHLNHSRDVKQRAKCITRRAL